MRGTLPATAARVAARRPAGALTGPGPRHGPDASRNLDRVVPEGAGAPLAPVAAADTRGRGGFVAPAAGFRLKLNR